MDKPSSGSSEPEGRTERVATAGESMFISMHLLSENCGATWSDFVWSLFQGKKQRERIGEAKVQALAKVFIRLKDRSTSACIGLRNEQAPCMWVRRMAVRCGIEIRVSLWLRCIRILNERCSNPIKPYIQKVCFGAGCFVNGREKL